jgi:hypothetical protein
MINYYELSKNISFDIVLNSGIKIFDEDVQNCVCYSEDKFCYHNDGLDSSGLVKYLYKQEYWFMSALSENPNITVDIVKNNLDKKWCYEALTKNICKNSLEIALLNPEIPWYWRSINKNINNLKSYLDKWCWISLSKNKNIYRAIIKDYSPPKLISEIISSRKLFSSFGFNYYDRSHTENDKNLSDILEYNLNIDREKILRVINRIQKKDDRIYENIIFTINPYF